MKKAAFFRLIFIAILSLAVLCAFNFKPDDTPLDKLLTALAKWTDTNPQEKVYLHMDKPYYAVGDTIWFKGYIATGSRHQLSAISGALYVDLINEQDSVIRALKLPVMAGTAMGDFTLGDELKAGNYRIRAYTQWMRNAGDAYFFDKTFIVGSAFDNDVVTRADYQYKDIDKKNLLTATLNYTDDKGQPLINKNVLYRIVIDKNIVWTKNAKTDAQGNIQVQIANENKADLAGAYIRTILNNNANKEVVKDFPIKANLSQSDVQFFPESGNLVNGILSRVAFKAIGVDGLGLNISGSIVDDENKDVTTFSTLHAGMGNFSVKPEAGKTYTAKINFNDGTVKTVALPKANDDGYTLSVYQPNKDSILVRINASQKQIGTPQGLSLIAQTGGETVFASTIKIDKPMTSVWLEKKAFPTGIAQFTIFNNNNEPLNERIAFIRSNDQMRLSIKPNKNTYGSKEKATIAVEAKDSDGKPTAGNFSVSVIDESKIPGDEMNETNILTNLLLTSDIKGYVEKPNYYFINPNDDVDKAMDDLMLTQGYRRFEWKEISQASKPPVFAAERLGITVSGKATSLSDKPVANATISILSIRANVNRVTKTDALGRFTFDNIFIRDSMKLTVQARTAKNSDKIKLVLDKNVNQRVTKNPNIAAVSLDIGSSLKAYIDAEQREDDINLKMGRMDQVHRLRQVNIKAAKAKPEIYAAQQNYRLPDGHAERTVLINEERAEKVGDLGMYLASQIPNIVMKSFSTQFGGFVPLYPYFRGKPMSIILDGRLLNAEDGASLFDNSAIQVTDIVKIELVLTNMALLKMLTSTESPVMFIYTKSQDQVRRSYNPAVANITPNGFSKVRTFYSPKYDNVTDANKFLDSRSTIFWEPYLKVDATGKGTFGFFNSDAPANYKVIVEGINSKGEITRQVARYKVGDSY